MKKLKNYRFSLHFLIFTGVLFFLASCSRQTGSVSYNNEKLRKQSIEIENSTSKAKTATVATPAQEQNETITSAEETITASNTEEPVILSPAAARASADKAVKNDAKDKKLTFAQKLLLKKLQKKLNPDQKMDAKRGGIDGNLRYAIIFGGVGIILIILGNIAWIFYILGVISLVIGLIFLLLWVLEQ